MYVSSHFNVRFMRSGALVRFVHCSVLRARHMVGGQYLLREHSPNQPPPSFSRTLCFTLQTEDFSQITISQSRLLKSHSSFKIHLRHHLFCKKSFSSNWLLPVCSSHSTFRYVQESFPGLHRT